VTQIKPNGLKTVNKPNGTTIEYRPMIDVVTTKPNQAPEENYVEPGTTNVRPALERQSDLPMKKDVLVKLPTHHNFDSNPRSERQEREREGLYRSEPQENEPVLVADDIKALALERNKIQQSLRDMLEHIKADD